MKDLPKTYLPAEIVVFRESVSGQLSDDLESTVAELGKIHHLPKHVCCHISLNRKRAEQGSYDPRSAAIEISRHAINPAETLIHEFGHFLDNRILHPLSNGYASRYDLELVEIMSWCMDSRPIQDATKILRTQRSRLSRSDRSFLHELLEPQEIFARI